MRQDTRDVKAEAEAGGVGAIPRTFSKEPITLPGSACVNIIGQEASQKIEQAVDLYHAKAGGYPRTLDEFIERIIKPNGIRLPELPFYRDYTYIVVEHRLAIKEDPTRQAGADYPRKGGANHPR